MLQSSLSEEEAEDLLWSAIATSPFLSQQLDSEDALALAKYLTIVPFDVADVVMQKGETASWVGLVLAGALQANVAGEAIGAPMGAGSIVGEIAFFHGGTRSADVSGSEAGYLATVLMGDLHQLFSGAPTTARRFVHALGVSSMAQILGVNHAAQTPLAFELTQEEAEPEIGRWQRDHFLAEICPEHEISEEDGAYLLSCLRYHRFEPGERLVDAATLHECVYFVVSGTVAVIEPKVGGSERRTSLGVGEKVLCDVDYFQKGLLPAKVIGDETGILACLGRDVIASLSASKPLLALALLRMIGSSAVTACFEAVKKATKKARRISIAAPALADSATADTASSRPITPQRHEDMEVLFRHRLAQQDVQNVRAEQEMKKAQHEVMVVKEEARKLAHSEQSFRLALKRSSAEQQKAQKLLADAKLEGVRMLNMISDLRSKLKHTKEENRRLLRKSTAAGVDGGGGTGGAPDEGGGDAHAGDGADGSHDGSFRSGDGTAKRSRSTTRTKESELERELTEARKELAQVKSEVKGVIAELHSAYSSNRELRAATEKLKQLLVTNESTAVKLKRALAKGNEDLERTTLASSQIRTALESGFANERGQLRAALEEARTGALLARQDGSKLGASLRSKEAELQIVARLFAAEMEDMEARTSERERELTHTINLQRLAAKGLGVVYVSQLYPLKRALVRLEKKVEQDKSMLMQMPFRIKVLQRQKQSADREVGEVTEALAQARAELQAERSARHAAEGLVASLGSDLSRATQRAEELDAHASHMAGEVAKRDLETRRLNAQLRAAQQRESGAERAAQHEMQRAELVSDSMAEMAKRMHSLEQSFGPLVALSATPATPSAPAAQSPLRRTLSSAGGFGRHGSRLNHSAAASAPRLPEVPSSPTWSTDAAAGPTSWVTSTDRFLLRDKRDTSRKSAAESRAIIRQDASAEYASPRRARRVPQVSSPTTLLVAETGRRQIVPSKTTLAL